MRGLSRSNKDERLTGGPSALALYPVSRATPQAQKPPHAGEYLAGSCLNNWAFASDLNQNVNPFTDAEPMNNYTRLAYSSTYVNSTNHCNCSSPSTGRSESEFNCKWQKERHEQSALLVVITVFFGHNSRCQQRISRRPHHRGQETIYLPPKMGQNHNYLDGYCTGDWFAAP